MQQVVRTAGIWRRWMAALTRGLARLRSGYRPERHYMRGGSGPGRP